MTNRALYLAISNRSPRQRGHFAIFIPNDPSGDLSTGNGLDEAHKAVEELLDRKGTIIQVIGEPVMQGYKLEFKRNSDCRTMHPVQKLVHLGYVDVYDVTNVVTADFSIDSTPKSTLERVAAQIPPPPKGQDARAPINGVTTKRCQEWTKDFIGRLREQGLVSPDAPERVHQERDSPTHGIFGYKAGNISGESTEASSTGLHGP